jgi:hypothetical protein
MKLDAVGWHSGMWRERWRCRYLPRPFLQDGEMFGQTLKQAQLKALQVGWGGGGGGGSAPHTDTKRNCLSPGPQLMFNAISQTDAA